MADQSQTKPSVGIRKRRGISLAWFVPMVAVVLGLWLVYKNRQESGPTVTISFQTAAGVSAGVTEIKYREVNIGQVEDVSISDDFNNVIVTARLDRQVASHLNDTTKFWIVRPRVGTAGVSGLGTLLSGAHIGFAATRGEGNQRSFTGLEQPPPVSAGSDGLRITLNADSAGSLIAGSPVYYKSFKAGIIESVALDDDFDKVIVNAFIESPYDQLVRQESRFWNVSGISARLDSQGISVNFQSLESLLFGGVEFDSPPLEQGASSLSDDQEHVFTLHSNIDDVEVDDYGQKVFYIVNFDQSIRGLNVDAAVEYRGLKIGRVVEISSRYDEANGEILLPVLIEIEPARLGINVVAGSTASEAHEALIDLGLRAKLETANLLTGQRFVSLDFYEDAEPVSLDDIDGFRQIPTESRGLNRITDNLEQALQKINRLELEELVDNMNQAVESIRTLADDSDQGIRQVLDSFEQTLARSRQMMGSGKLMFDQGQNVMMSLEEGSATRYEFDQMLKELRAAARSLKTLTESIEEKPNSLIFGRQNRERE